MLQQNIKQQWSFDIHNLYRCYRYCTFLSLFSVYRDPWTCVDIDDIHQPLMLAMAPPSDVATIRRGRLWEIGLEWLSGDSAVMWLATYELTLDTLLCPNTLLHILITRMIRRKFRSILPTIWTVEKQRWEESEEKRSEERRCRCAKR